MIMSRFSCLKTQRSLRAFMKNGQEKPAKNSYKKPTEKDFNIPTTQDELNDMMSNMRKSGFDKYHPDNMISYENIHKMNNRAMPNAIMLYKCAIQLFKIYNALV